MQCRKLRRSVALLNKHRPPLAARRSVTHNAGPFCERLAMKIRYFSDLHFDVATDPPARVPSIGEDVVVLAGDIDRGVRGIEWARAAIPDRPVLYVLGNHEFFGGDWLTMVDAARAAAAGSQVQVLEHDALVLGGVRFVGATLWTGFDLCPPAERDAAIAAAEKLMVDYRRIGNGDLPLRPSDVAARCFASRSWLTRTLPESALPTVVISHHSPSLANEHPRFAGGISGGAFHNALDALFQPPLRAWISGHTHHSGRVEVNGIPLLSNQRGYPREALPFDWDCCLTV